MTGVWIRKSARLCRASISGTEMRLVKSSSYEALAPEIFSEKDAMSAKIC